MKRNLMVFALVLTLAVANIETARADGGFGFSAGLRLSGDFSWSGWHRCKSNGPAMWPMAAPAYYPQPWGYSYPAPMMGGFDYGYAPGYAAPMQYAPVQASPSPVLPTPSKETPGSTNPTSMYHPASYNSGSAGFLFPSAVPAYWR
jgi:hypothetical protein